MKVLSCRRSINLWAFSIQVNSDLPVPRRIQLSHVSAAKTTSQIAIAIAHPLYAHMPQVYHIGCILKRNPIGPTGSKDLLGAVCAKRYRTARTASSN